MINNYKFTTNWFDAVSPGWDKLFDWYINQQENTIETILEIGCFEGKASTYMAEKWIKDGAQYHVVDTFGGSPEETGMGETMEKLKESDFIFDNFKHNTSFFPNIKWKIKRSISQYILPVLERKGYKYDFIYVDASHMADDTFVDAYWAHRMLKPGGIIIFDDFGWSDPNRKGMNDSPKFGIQSFVTLYEEEYDVVLNNYQVGLVKKHQ